MIDTNIISPSVIKAAEQDLSRLPSTKKIFDITKRIDITERELKKLQAELNNAKADAPKINVKWRDSIRWCLDIDKLNKPYFIKTTESVYKCIAFKYAIDLTPDMRNKIATTLSILFREGEIGRISYYNNVYYGLSEFFKSNLTELKDEYIEDLNTLTF